MNVHYWKLLFNSSLHSIGYTNEQYRITLSGIHPKHLKKCQFVDLNSDEYHAIITSLIGYRLSNVYVNGNDYWIGSVRGKPSPRALPPGTQ